MATGGRDPVNSLAKFISEFNSQLASNKSGSLAQIWMPETGEDGSIVLNTQGLPYSINGVGDLLALFRCISCKYKFTTDLSKTHTMGAVGRVFTSGEPEMSGHVQRYDQQVYLRAAEAQRCRVHSTLFMPIYASPRRDACLAVFEVVLTDADVNFAGMVGWIISCLQSEGLYTAEVDTANIMNQGLGMRGLGPHDYDGASALESGVAPRQPLPGGGGAMRPTLADDGGSERQHAIAAVAAAGSSLDILTATAALPQAQADGEGLGGQAGPRQGQLGGGGSAPDAKRKRAAGESSGCGGAAQEDGEKPRLQRVPSGPVGLASPAPQQQPIVTGDGSGSGSGAVQAQAQDPAQPQVSHRLSGSLPLRRNGSLPVVLNGMNGSGHLSGSGLPSGSTAQLRQPADAAPLAPIVAAAVQQLLAQNSPQLQLAALLAGGAMSPQLPAALGGPFASLGAPGSSGGLAGSGVNGLLMNGTSPAVTAGLRPQRQQAQQQRYDRQEDEAAGGEEDEDEEDEETDDDKPFMRPAPGAAQKYGQGNRVLTYEDLAAQFGYGLKEAASRLNICPTTLKRACRRLGIPRWPRRELVKHKRQKKASRAEAGGGGSQPPPPQQQQQAQQQQAAAGNGSLAKGLSSGSGPSSGAGNDPQQFMLAAAAAAAASPAQQQQQGLPRPGSSSMLTGLPGLQGMEHLLPVPIVGGASDGSQLAPDLLAAIANTLTQQQQQQQQHGMMPAGANPVLVGQVMQFLQQQQQQQQQHGGSPWPSSLQPQLQPGGLDHILGSGFQLQGAVAGLGQLHSQSSRGNGIPLAPLLSNLGLPRRGDSKLQSMGHGMGSLDILAAADLEGSVGNMSVGNSPRIAISNLGGLSQLGLSGFDFGGMAAGGEPAATATNDGGATGPQNGPAFSTGAMPARQAEK